MTDWAASVSHCRRPPTLKVAKQVGKQWYRVTGVLALYSALLSLEQRGPDPVRDGIPGGPTWEDRNPGGTSALEDRVWSQEICLQETK